MSGTSALRSTDAAIYDLIRQEDRRQVESIRLIASENYTSAAVLEAAGSSLSNKYSEGYPGRRYYEGQEYVDQIESLAIERAKSLFGAAHANVQSVFRLASESGRLPGFARCRRHRYGSGLAIRWPSDAWLEGQFLGQPVSRRPVRRRS